MSTVPNRKWSLVQKDSDRSLIRFLGALVTSWAGLHFLGPRYGTLLRSEELEILLATVCFGIIPVLVFGVKKPLVSWLIVVAAPFASAALAHLKYRLMFSGILPNWMLN